jgi:hypothetical protein
MADEERPRGAVGKRQIKSIGGTGGGICDPRGGFKAVDTEERVELESELRRRDTPCGRAATPQPQVERQRISCGGTDTVKRIGVAGT